jgi:hypothetical protein
MHRKGILSFLVCLILLATDGANPAKANKQSDGEVCALASKNADQLGYDKLVAAAVVCYRADRVVDGTFFLLVSQIRIHTDTELFIPANEGAKTKLSQFFGYYFYKAGGSGPEKLYRSKAKRKKLFSRLRNWKASTSPGYNPGWDYKGTPSNEDVAEVSERRKYNRLQKVVRYATLIANDEYYETKKRSDELAKKHRGQFVYNSPAYKQSAALSKKLGEITKKLKLPELNLKSQTKFRIDPDADFKSIYRGANGPNTAMSMIIDNGTDIQETFLSTALTDTQIKKITAEVNFEKEVLIIIAIGARQTATGALVVTSLTVRNLGKKPSLSYSIKIGVLEKGCKLPSKKSYPFIVLRKQRPNSQNKSRGRGRSRGNFPDGCKKQVTGTPNNHPENSKLQ